MDKKEEDKNKTWKKGGRRGKGGEEGRRGGKEREKK